MGNSVTCGVCGTVNVGGGRCIACGQPIAADPVLMDPTLPLEAAAVAQPTSATVALDPPPAATPERPKAPEPPPAPPQPATEPLRRRSATGEVAASAARRTIVEGAAPPATGAVAPDEEIVGGRAPGTAPIAFQDARAPSIPGGARFVVRLLLPEGDKQLADVGSHPVRLGSGLDELGLPGDPRVRPGEATLRVVDGTLWVETVPDATGIYRRIDGEETLRDGDVILMGDVAAEFRSLPPAPAPAANVHILGGSAPPAGGRLSFLRRDGTPGPVHDLPLGKTIVGRTDGHVNFPQDSRLSRRHVRFHATGTEVTVEDLDSRNGTYVRLRGRRALEVGEALRVGSAGVQVRARA